MSLFVRVYLYASVCKHFFALCCMRSSAYVYVHAFVQFVCIVLIVRICSYVFDCMRLFVCVRLYAFVCMRLCVWAFAWTRVLVRCFHTFACKSLFACVWLCAFVCKRAFVFVFCM